MGRGGKSSNSVWVRQPGAQARPVVFIDRLTSSTAFTKLFREGMALVEESAAYLDGPGRVESRQLPRTAALAYATESMRLTTRLMQIASWLLLQRAVNEGDLTPVQALSEKHRVRLARQEIVCANDVFASLPASLRALSMQSLRLQARVLHLDVSLEAARNPTPAPANDGVAIQINRLRAAFAH